MRQVPAAWTPSSSDEHGRAKINYDKCVSCGMCLVNCPFGAIADKSQIFQVIMAIKLGERRSSPAVAPAFVGQFGGKRHTSTSCARPS